MKADAPQFAAAGRAIPEPVASTPTETDRRKSFLKGRHHVKLTRNALTGEVTEATPSIFNCEKQRKLGTMSDIIGTVFQSLRLDTALVG